MTAIEAYEQAAAAASRAIIAASRDSTKQAERDRAVEVCRVAWEAAAEEWHERERARKQVKL